MTRNGSLLELGSAPDVRQLVRDVNALLMAWPNPGRWPHRSDWLGEFEARLQESFPLASGADLRRTARTFAPFDLRAGRSVA